MNRPILPLARILVPVDFSDCSRAAVGPARLLAELTGAEVLLAHVLGRTGLVEYHPLLVDEIRDELAHRRMASLERMAGGVFPGMKVRCFVTAGVVEEELIRLAIQEKADLIVMGTHDWSGWRRGFVERVVRTAPCPVLTVRAAGTPPAETPPQAPGS